MVFQIALDFVPHLVDRDSLDGRRQLFEDILRLDSGPFGNDAEYGQAEIADILFYFVIYFVVSRLLFAIEVRQANDEEILRRFELGFFTEWGVCFQSPGDARAEVFDKAELIDNVYESGFRYVGIPSMRSSNVAR